MSTIILAQQGDEGGVVVGVGLLILLVGGFFLYFIPTIIAFARKVPNKGSVAVINFFLGWSVIGWIVALAMSLASRGPAFAVGQPGQIQGQSRECPFCRSNIRADASVCPHCQRESEPWILKDNVWWARDSNGDWMYLSPNGWRKHEAIEEREERQRPVWPPPPSRP